MPSVNESVPIMTATSCCFSADVSFPTAWYDFETSDSDFGALAADADARFPWALKREIAYFRGSIYWFEGHGRTRAFAQSLVAPGEIDADWYERIDATALDTNAVNIFGNISEHARYKYLLSLEGHSYWSFRLRTLLHLNSAVLHQDLPCHEFWHALLRPYEHYIPLARNLTDLRARLRYLRAHDDAVRRMTERMRRLARRILSRNAVVGYVRELFEQYALLQTERVRLRGDAILLDLER